MFIYNKLDELYLLAENISDLLSQKNEFETKDIQNLADIYKKRRTIVDEINEYFKSAEGTAFLKDNQKSWEQRTEALMKLDKKNIENIEIRVKDLNSRLRKFVDNKKILLYTKQP